MSDAPLDNPLPPITPLSKQAEQRLTRDMKALKQHYLRKNKLLDAMNFNTSVFIPACLQQIQERRNAASERNNEPTVEVSPAKQQALGQSTNSEQEEFDGLVLSEEDIQRADERLRTLQTQANKYDTWIRDCQERIDNEGYPTQVVILRRNLNRLRKTNLVLLSPKEIEELNVLVGRFLVEEQEEGWA
ncbi:Ff.00g015900.m01.CDS01 [Fusarium sp. VM40]|nr:Ff.00g015900.m01.CDS01 [Fusarium sp. VM40]